jgi:hypothetical protein
MSILHERWRRRVSLLAAGCLDEAERAATLAHIERCAACRSDREALERTLAELARDPERRAEPDVAVEFLVTRVQARLDEVVRSRSWRLGWVAAGFATALVVATLVPRLLPRIVPAQDGAEGVTAVATGGVAEPAARQVELPDAALRRLERAVVREQAARYLVEAQHLLVTVASSRERCKREEASVDVSQEARRSRELLARRALVVDVEGDAVAAARPVIEDVERLLRDVAALEACARQRDLDQIHDSIKRRKLLMKIDLMEKELLG